MGTEAKFPHTGKHADGKWVTSKSESIGGVNSYEHLDKHLYEINNRKVKQSLHVDQAQDPRQQAVLNAHLNTPL